jgi:predicted RNA-binding protein with PIN domain
MNTLIVDGYNVIGRIPALRQKKAESLEAARTALAHLVAAWRSGHGGHDCLIVFDGKDSAGVSGTVIGGVRCLFTRTKVEADDEIIRAVRDGGGSGITVVSDDNYVGNNCRAHGAAVRPASFFEEAETGRAAKQFRKTGAGEKTLDRKSASDIDKEQRERFGL